MKHILIPTDFSKNAWNAALYAIELFKNEKCVFHLLNVYTPAILNSRFLAVNFNGRASVDRERLHSERGLKELLKQFKNIYDNPEHRFNTISSFSLLVDGITEVVENDSIDLIVMGTKGLSGRAAVFMGSNAVCIIKSIKNCPVLAIPQHFEFVTPSEIALATDFNRFYTQSELQPLIDMANAFDAVIRIVHVQDNEKALTEIQQFNLGMLRKYFNNVEHYVHTVSELNSVSKTLEVFTNELDIHLLAMLNYKHSQMERMTREPVVKCSAFHTQIPLLVIPELGLGMSPRRKISKENRVSYY